MMGRTITNKPIRLKTDFSGRKATHQPVRGRDLVRYSFLILIAVGIYLLTLTASPAISPRIPPQTYANEVLSTDTLFEQNIIVIPKLNVTVPIYEGTEEVLERGAWHRFPERGDPVSGGNFIVSAHRLTLGMTPEQTRKRSPFYNLHLLQKDDLILIIWDGAKYRYSVIEIFEVKPHQVEIEDRTDLPILTLYSCTLAGEYDGRLVVRARLKPQIEEKISYDQNL